MGTDRDTAGRALYESRLKYLSGLMMPPAPAWEELPEPDREHWRAAAERERSQGEQHASRD